MYGYSYSDYGYASSAYDSLGLFGNIVQGYLIFSIILVLIVLVVGIIQTIGFWKIFKKAGKGGWEAIVPYYGNWVLVQIAGLHWWWFLLFFAPIVTSFIGLSWLGYLANIFASFTCYYNLSKKFNKGVGFAICFTLFTPICACILGFSKKAVYNSNVAVSINGLFGAPTNNNDNNYQNGAQPMQQQPMNQPMQGIQPMNETLVNPTVTPVAPVMPEVQPVSTVAPMPEPIQPINPQPMAQPVTPVEPVIPEVNISQQSPVMEQPSAQPKFCTKCGAQTLPGSKFCVKCGNQL